MSDSYSHVVFTAPGKAEFVKVPQAGLPAEPQTVIIKTEYSIVSPGTELACLGGKESWAPHPFVPGYGSVGRVVRTGKTVSGLAVGQRVFTYSEHAEYAPTRELAIPLSDTIDPIKATFARIAAVSITALRVADVALGDTVAVFGLGLVGNLAAQLFALSGCEVIGIDPSEKRRQLAQQCGISTTLSSSENLQEAIATLTGGKMCRTVVDATGVPAVAATAGSLAGKSGELILLGSPRGEYTADLTPFLNQTHLWDRGCITVKGAHEWRFPLLEDPKQQGRFSIEGNVRAILKLIEKDKLSITPLLSHLVSPVACQSVYDGLKNEKDTYIGVVYDWSKI